MNDSVGLIFNPRGHLVARHGSMLQAAAASLPGAHVLRLDDFGHLEAFVADIARSGVRRIFVEGGDGTLLAALSACLAPGSGFTTPPDFAVLPGGSTNLAAKVFGFRAKTPAEVLRRIAALVDGTEAPVYTEQSALKLSHAGLPRAAIGFFMSTGSLPRAMLYTQREFHREDKRGSLMVAAAIARFVLTPGRYIDRDGAPVFCASSLRVDYAGRQIDGLHALSFVSPLPHLSLGLTPFWGGGEGALALTHAAWPIRGFRRALLKVLLRQTGPGLAAHGFSSFRSDRFDVLHEGPVMLDGEILPAAPDGRLAITATPKLRFLR